MKEDVSSHRFTRRACSDKEKFNQRLGLGEGVDCRNKSGNRQSGQCKILKQGTTNIGMLENSNEEVVIRVE